MNKYLLEKTNIVKKITLLRIDWFIIEPLKNTKDFNANA